MALLFKDSKARSLHPGGAASNATLRSPDLAGLRRGLAGWVGIAMLLLFACRALAFDWTLIKYDGHDYVPVEDVAKFYSFTRADYSNATVNLTGATLRMQGEVNSRDLYLNGLKFILSFPIIKVDDKILLSRMDLSKLVEPVLRPAKISGVRVRTVVLDAGHGGFDQGARGLLGNEKDFALDVVLRARDLLLQAGYNVRLRALPTSSFRSRTVRRLPTANPTRSLSAYISI